MASGHIIYIIISEKCFSCSNKLTCAHPNFTSDEFESFLHANGIAHTRTAPYHPALNGLAELAVQNFKLGIRRLKDGTIEKSCPGSCSSTDSHHTPQLGVLQQNCC